MKFYYNKEDIECGVDEVGRGCLFGPVVAASCIFSKEFPEDLEENDIPKIRDSKKLSEKQRNIAYDFIKEYCLDYTISFIDHEVIDEINILNATYEAMHKAIDDLNIDINHILVDGDRFKMYKTKKNDIVPHICIKGGDDKYYPIAMASILAKVTRDRYIEELCDKEPELHEKYDLRNNKGYGTKKHIQGIHKYGLSRYHRKTFGICKQY